MPPQDRRSTHAVCAGSEHEFALLQSQHLPAHDARRVQPVDRADRDEDQHDVPPEQHHHEDHEKQEGQRIEDVDHAHHQGVDATACEARDCAVGDPEQQRHERGRECDGERDAPAFEAAHEDIAAEAVGAEPVRAGQCRRHTPFAVEVDSVHRMWRQQRPESQRQRDQRQTHRSRKRRAMREEARPGCAHGRPTRGSSQP